MSWWSTCPGTCGTSDCAHVRRTTPPTARRIYRAFEGPEPDVRNMFERIVFTKEVWTAAIGGRDIPPRDQRRAVRWGCLLARPRQRRRPAREEGRAYAIPVGPGLRPRISAVQSPASRRARIARRRSRHHYCPARPRPGHLLRG